METLKKIIAKTLGVKETEIYLNSSPETVPSWDSFNSFMIISEIETNFGIKLSSDDVMGIKSVKDLVKVLEKLDIKEVFLHI